MLDVMTDKLCTCCGEKPAVNPQSLGAPKRWDGQIMCESCNTTRGCSGCDQDNCDEHYLWESVQCDACEAYDLRVSLTDKVDSIITARGWKLEGVSGKSEAKYYEHPNHTRRIRIAAHDSPYMNYEYYINVGDKAGYEDNLHITYLTSAEEIIAAIAEMEEACRRKVGICSTCGDELDGDDATAGHTTCWGCR